MYKIYIGLMDWGLNMYSYIMYIPKSFFLYGVSTALIVPFIHEISSRVDIYRYHGFVVLLVIKVKDFVKYNGYIYYWKQDIDKLSII